MTDLEIAAIAEGIFKHLQSSSDSPLDGLAILGTACLMIYSACRDLSKPAFTIESFAKDFHDGLIASWQNRSDEGTRTIQ